MTRRGGRIYRGPTDDPINDWYDRQRRRDTEVFLLVILATVAVVVARYVLQLF